MYSVFVSSENDLLLARATLTGYYKEKYEVAVNDHWQTSINGKPIERLVGGVGLLVATSICEIDQPMTVDSLVVNVSKTYRQANEKGAPNISMVVDRAVNRRILHDSISSLLGPTSPLRDHAYKFSITGMGAYYLFYKDVNRVDYGLEVLEKASERLGWKKPAYDKFSRAFSQTYSRRRRAN